MRSFEDMVFSEAVDGAEARDVEVCRGSGGGCDLAGNAIQDPNQRSLASVMAHLHRGWDKPDMLFKRHEVVVERLALGDILKAIF